VDLYIEDHFRVNGKMYGVLKSKSSKEFEMFVSITRFDVKGQHDWLGVNPTLQNALKNIYYTSIKKKD
jgi:hypothetical protein